MVILPHPTSILSLNLIVDIPNPPCDLKGPLVILSSMGVAKRALYLLAKYPRYTLRTDIPVPDANSHVLCGYGVEFSLRSRTLNFESCSEAFAHTIIQTGKLTDHVFKCLFKPFDQLLDLWMLNASANQFNPKQYVNLT